MYFRTDSKSNFPRDTSCFRSTSTLVSDEQNENQFNQPVEFDQKASMFLKDNLRIWSEPTKEVRKQGQNKKIAMEAEQMDRLSKVENKIEKLQGLEDKIANMEKLMLQNIEFVNRQLFKSTYQPEFEVSEVGGGAFQSENQLRNKERKLPFYEQRIEELSKRVDQLEKQVQSGNLNLNQQPKTGEHIMERNFQITNNGNKVTLGKETGDWQLLMHDKVIKGQFHCYFHVNFTKRGDFCLGLADRLTQRGKKWVESSHGIKYDGCGVIEYASGEGQYRKKYGRKDLGSGMGISMIVNFSQCKVTFAFSGLNPKEQSVICPILAEHNRQFVCFIQLQDAGDSISWNFP